MSKKVTRLYQQFHPSHYDLDIKLAQDKLSLSGKTIITGNKTGRPSKRITLHQKNLKITSATITQIDKKGIETPVEVTRTVNQDSYDEVRLHTDKDIYPGAYKIEIHYTAKITKHMEGVYPCFFEEEGVKKRLIATQFESHHAREAFPCIDEPEAKATFQLTLTHSKDEIALSNTAVESENVEGDNKTTKFHVTPIMSTYLVAFVAGEISYKEAVSKNNVKIRTYATKNQVEHTQFALDVAVKCMDYYEDYYDIPFPIEKCDFIALPDFASGAMENWGLITFREQTMLCDEQNTSLSTKQYVAMVVAHELTHQWFGNLVTMQWWTDLWLNEGFASWMEYLAIDELFPTWNLWSQFAIDEQQLALKLDALEHTHAIEVAINHPDEIRTIFDAISYQKGASVIHMLHQYLGSVPFRDGLRHYLKKHAYGNTHTADLWQALEDITKKPVKQFMSAWTSQSGFPIVEVESRADHLQVTQSRFVTNPESTARADSALWPVPLLSADLKKPIADKQTTNIPFSGSSAPVKINVGQTGFFRVNYSHDMQLKQLEALDKGAIDPIDVMGLLSDSFEVTKAGYQPVQEYLDLLEHFSKSEELGVWEIIAGSIGTIRSILSTSDTDTTLREAIKPFVIDLVSVQLQRLGWDQKPEEKHLDTLLRPIILSMSVSSDDKTQVDYALDLYKQKIESKIPINPDLRGLVYSTATRLGGLVEFDQLFELYKSSDSSDEKMSITAALTSFKQPEIHMKILDLIKSDEIRLQDISYWIAYSFMNRHSKQATWEWLQENWQWLKDNIGGDLSFSRTPVYAARSFADEKFMREYQEFFESRMEPMLVRTYAQGLEMVQTNTAWRKRDAANALDWFLIPNS